MLHDLRGVLYVGATGNLNRRFHQHYWLTEDELLAEAMRRPLGETQKGRHQSWRVEAVVEEYQGCPSAKKNDWMAFPNLFISRGGGSGYTLLNDVR